MSEIRHYDSLDAGVEWGTPRHIWKPLGDSLPPRGQPGFTLDPASGAEPEPIARNRFTVEDDGLAQDWYGHVWLNPPYSREHNPLWGKKVLMEWRSGNVKSITALIPASTETGWFQDHYAKADMLTFLSERVNFIGAGDNGASFPSVIATFGLPALPRGYIEALEDLGETYPKTEKILWRLVSAGCTPAQALDYYFTEVVDHTRTDWAEVRGVDHSSISHRVKSVTESHTIQGVGDGI